MKGLPKKLKIRILASDFKDSKYLSLNDCPIARACVRDLWIDTSLIRVGGYGVDFDMEYWYSIADKDSKKVADMFKEVAPKDFTMILTLMP